MSDWDVPAGFEPVPLRVRRGDRLGPAPADCGP